MLLVICRHCGWQQKTNAQKSFKCVRCEKTNQVSKVIKQEI